MSSMLYIPAGLSFMNSAARNAPCAKISFEKAPWLIVIVSSRPAKITSCCPTILPPLTACIPI